MWTLAVAGLLLCRCSPRRFRAGTVGFPSPRATSRPVDADRSSRSDSEPSATLNPAAAVERTPARRGPAAADARRQDDPASPGWPCFRCCIRPACCCYWFGWFSSAGSVRRLARRAADVSDPEWTRLLIECAAQIGVRRPVRLLRSLERSMPMAFGIGTPPILIPAVADTWSEDRRRAVLLHELAHVARHDCLTQLMAAVGLRRLLDSSRRVVGRAAPARRARARLRRSRGASRRPRSRICRAPAGARLHARRLSRARACRRDGAPATARRAHARGARCRA